MSPKLKGNKHLRINKVTAATRGFVYLSPASATVSAAIPFAIPKKENSLKKGEMAVPVIDVAGFRGAERERIKAEIAKACEETGFFQILNHGIPLALLDRVKDAATENFRLEREKEFNDSAVVDALQKALLEENPKEIRDMNWEDVFALQYDDPHYEWPSQPAHFKETMKEFGKAVKTLTEEFLELLSENLGLEKDYLKKALAGDREPYFGTKVSHYPPCPRPDLVRGLRAHTDAGGLIMLFQDDKVGGLQCKNKKGEWVDVQPLSNAIVINTGDQLETISNGKYKSAWHRISATKDGNRMSVASYYNPSLETLVQPASALLQPDSESNGGGDMPMNYPKYLFGEYMNVYAKQKYLAKKPRFQAAAKSTAL